jgi:hypothetical protein
MRHAYIEPSAWVKRYYREAGTDLTNYLQKLWTHPTKGCPLKSGSARVPPGRQTAAA